jgi:hypothetical protein
VKVYYTVEEVIKGDIDGIPPISKITLRNLRSSKKIKYTKIGRKTFFKKIWILEYLESNIHEVKVKDK